LNAYMDIILRLLGFSGVFVGFGEGVYRSAKSVSIRFHVRVHEGREGRWDVDWRGVAMMWLGSKCRYAIRHTEFRLLLPGRGQTRLDQGKVRQRSGVRACVCACVTRVTRMSDRAAGERGWERLAAVEENRTGAQRR
jgi:hypothetical protein